MILMIDILEENTVLSFEQSKTNTLADRGLRDELSVVTYALKLRHHFRDFQVLNMTDPEIYSITDRQTRQQIINRVMTAQERLNSLRKMRKGLECRGQLGIVMKIEET